MQPQSSTSSSLVSRTCLQCGIEFYVKPFEVKRGRAKFCSRSCSNNSMRRASPSSNRIARVCLNCGTQFYVKPSAVVRDGGNFCSRVCSLDKARHDARTSVALICQHCGKEFEVRLSRASVRKHCSKKCRRASEGAFNRKDYTRKRYQERLAAGLCTYCGSPNDRPGKTQCTACSRRANLIRNPHLFAAGPCVLCGFEYSDVHHIDGRRSNNDPSNLICLCPNHHRLVHRGLLTVSDIRATVAKQELTAPSSMH